MPRAGLSRDGVVDIAIAVVDDAGPPGLTLAAVAARAGVATPSLYKHVGGLAELQSLVGARVIVELTERLSDATLGRAGDDALRALMRSYRTYVVEHPNRYAAMPVQPLQDPVLERPAQRLLHVVQAVLRGFDLEGSAAIHATRCIRAAAHGFGVLEAAGGFGLPEDLDASHELLTDMVATRLRAQAHT
jgi:AcrR family transcriptional regulator